LSHKVTSFKKDDTDVLKSGKCEGSNKKLKYINIHIKNNIKIEKCQYTGAVFVGKGRDYCDFLNKKTPRLL